MEKTFPREERNKHYVSMLEIIFEQYNVHHSGFILTTFGSVRLISI